MSAFGNSQISFFVGIDLKAAYGRGVDLSSPIYEIGRNAGIEFDPNRLMVPTMQPHRLIEFAKRHDKQDAVVEEIFHQFFEKAAVINRKSVLVQIAKKTGLDEVLGNVCELRI